MNAKKAIDQITAALDGPLATEFSAFDVLNAAGRFMESVHEWRYLTKTARTLSLRGQVIGSAASFTAASSTLTLTGAFTNYSFVPGDFAELHDGATLLGRFNVASRVSNDAVTLDASLDDITGTAAFTLDTARIGLPIDVDRIKRVFRGRPNSGGAFVSSVTELQALDESYLTGGSFVVGYALEWGTATAKAIPVPVLRLWPPTSEASADALSVVYLRAWPEIDSEADIIPIPPYMNTLFLEVCRAYAQGLEDSGRLDAYTQGMQQGDTFIAATRYDTGGLQSMGLIGQGAVRRRQTHLGDNHSANFIHRHLEQ